MQLLVTKRSTISIGARHFIEQPTAFIAISLKAFAKLSNLGDCGVASVILQIVTCRLAKIRRIRTTCQADDFPSRIGRAVLSEPANDD